ncbi:ArsR/SmtB family transcription factor [Oceanobacillus sojae]|uniref:ArsR/SmtB family transcription factor n=1 Tax=Oceanobacillus sojae TaxID=582851 RepID=UPI0009888B9C|nr:metalloregulator ArsR/SmtB family transcription factor [Oceanobacillus sojae]MCT1903737.1 metalloregulator ArsR/SmtB family transcription factor [Oceanobacillus sojae]
MKTDKMEKLKYGFEEVKDFLIALGDEKRQIIIIALLNDHACKGLRVIDLTDLTELSRPAVSHHLKILKQIGIVDIRREGTKNYYYLSNAASEINKLRNLLDDVMEVMTEKKEEL